MPTRQIFLWVLMVFFIVGCNTSKDKIRSENLRLKERLKRLESEITQLKDIKPSCKEEKVNAPNADSSVAPESEISDKPQIIIQYDGISWGSTLEDVKNIVKNNNDAITELTKVPQKSYYSYDIRRTLDWSNVTVYISDKRGVYFFKDIISGKYGIRTNTEVTGRYYGLIGKYKELWGKPFSQSNSKCVWRDTNVTATLTVDIPDNSYGLPILKLKIMKWK